MAKANNFTRKISHFFSRNCILLCVSLLNTIVFSVCLSGIVNRHNCRYWSAGNSHWMKEVHTQYRQKIDVWGGMVANHIIGPLFLRDNLNGDGHLHLFRNHIVPALIALVLNTNASNSPNENTWFQQEGAPPYFLRTSVIVWMKYFLHAGFDAE